MILQRRSAGPIRACILAFVLASPTASAQSAIIIVNGTLRSKPDCQTPVQSAKDAYVRSEMTCGLFWGKMQSNGTRIASAKTTPKGRFKLVPEGVSKTQYQDDLLVACPPQDEISCGRHQLVPSDYSLLRGSLSIADVELTCTLPMAGGTPAATAEALTALADWHQLLVWAGEEQLDAADAALKSAVARADKPLKAEERERLKAAFAAAAAPLRDGSRQRFSLLPSLRDSNFASELISAAPARRWLLRPGPNDQRPTPYGERQGQFEGSVTRDVGFAFSDTLVSLTKGPLVVDPKQGAKLTLRWSASAGPRVCIEASPNMPTLDWKMRAAAASGSVSFTWDLTSAWRAGMATGTLGVIARSCVDADHERGPYVPLGTASAPPAHAAYRLVFLLPRQVTEVLPVVFQDLGSSRRVIPLPSDAIKFDPDSTEPLITIDVPAANLKPGIVNIEMRTRGPGQAGPEVLSFLHERK